MKNIIIILTALMFLLSCTKTKTQMPPIKPDYFMFGLNYVAVKSNNNMVFNTHYYYLKGHKLFVINPFLMTPALTLDSVLSNDDYLRASALVNNFPLYLRNKPDTSYGSLCCSAPVLHLEYMENDTVRLWNINVNDNELPVPLKGYPGYVMSVINSLK